MFIHFKLYRSKVKDEIFDVGKLQYNINNTDELLFIDDIISKITSEYITDHELIKKNGLAYMDRMEITLIEITDEDVIEISETECMRFLQTELPKFKFVWNKSKFNPDLK